MVNDRAGGERWEPGDLPFLRAVLAASHDVVAVIEHDGIIRWISPSVQRLLDFHPDDLIGRPLDVLSPNAPVVMTCAEPVELELRCAGPGTRWVEAVFYDAKGITVIDGTVLFARDITDQKRAAEREAFLHRVIAETAAAPDLQAAVAAFSDTVAPLAPHDRAGYAVLEADCLRLAALTDTANAFMRVGQLIPLDDPLVAHALDTARPLVAPEDPPPGLVAQLRAVGMGSLLALPVRAGGRNVGLITLSASEPHRFDDVDLDLLALAAVEAGGIFSTLDALERERAAADRLRELDRAKDDFVAMVAHDLRSPLTVVAGFADTLWMHGSELPANQRTELLQGISRRVEGVLALVRQVLEVEALEAGSVVLGRRAIDLVEPLERAIADVRMLHPRQAIELRAAPGLPQADVDPLRVAEIVTNLLVNAVRYSPPDEVIEVTVEPDSNGLLVTVHDHGPGVDPSVLPTIFEPFSGASAGGPGHAAGLGLSICRRLVEAHGGGIGVRSPPGEGATFWFTLPAAVRPSG